ncbi:MAG: hypothetical protein O2816_15120 [Planctomycetota bacterium]|nr:hypothetical protein [Planctomycetota bacterium]
MTSPLVRLLALCALTAPVASTAGGQDRPAHAVDEELEAELRALRSQLVTILHELAGEAHNAKLYLQRDRLHLAVLELEPEHAASRKALGFKRTKQGAWEQPRYREPKDRGNQDALTEFEALRAARTAELRGQVLRALSGAEASRRLEALRTWLVCLPEDLELRAAAGESQAQDGRWLLTDSIAALRYRDQVDGLVRLADEAQPEPQPWSPPAHVAAVLGNPSGLRTPAGRVGGDVPEVELRAVLTSLWRAQRLLPVVLPVGEDVPIRLEAWRERFTIYLLQDTGDAPKLVTAFPNLPAAERTLLPKLASGWLEGAHVLGVWGMGPPGRLDAAIRQSSGAFLRDHFGLSTRHGWAWEGFGTVLTESITGSHLTFFVRPSRYEEGPGPNLSERLRADDADWLLLFTEQMTSEKPAQLAFLMGKDVNGLDERELLLAHTLAKWLLEARPAAALKVLKRLGEGHAGATVLEEELGMSLTFLEQHLVRWASETQRKPQR